MSYFNNIFLLKAPQAADLTSYQNLSDHIELCSLAAVIENDVESVSIPVDFNNKDPYTEFEHKLKIQPVDLVGISAMTGAINNALRLAKIAKNNKTYVIMGGYHPSAFPEDVLKSPYVDAIIIGEGEMTFKELVSRGPSVDITGLAFRENGRVTKTGVRPLINDLDSLPLPLRHIRPTRFDEPGFDYSFDTVFTSRGCPFNCTFCANGVINKNWRARSPENVFKELAQIHDSKRKKILKIWDANIFTNISRVEKICDLMIENNITNFRIWTEARVDDIIRAERILPKLKKIGLKTVSLGLESPNPETLKSMNKKLNMDNTARAMALLKNFQIRPQGYFIIGHYLETADDTKNFPEYAEALYLHESVFMIMTPYPGTAIFEEYKRENKIKSYDWDLYNNFCPVVETRGMDFETLKKMYAYCNGKFYLRRAFTTRSRSFISILSKIIGYFYIFYIIASLDKRNSPEDIKNFIFETVRIHVGHEYRTFQKKPSFLYNLFNHIWIRIRYSPGRSIDIVFKLDGQERQVKVSESTDVIRVRGATVDLNEFMRFLDRLPVERFTEVFFKIYIQKSYPNPGRNILKLFWKEPSILLDFIVLFLFFAKHSARTIFSLFLHPFSFRSKIPQ